MMFIWSVRRVKSMLIQLEISKTSLSNDKQTQFDSLDFTFYCSSFEVYNDSYLFKLSFPLSPKFLEWRSAVQWCKEMVTGMGEWKKFTATRVYARIKVNDTVVVFGTFRVRYRIVTSSPGMTKVYMALSLVESWRYE